MDIKILILLHVFFMQFQSYQTCNPGNYSSPDYHTCPKKVCTQNIECWEKKGVPQKCVCDETLCSSVCVPVSATCPDLKLPRNGNIKIIDNFVGSSVEFICDNGFALKGYGILHCQANRQWSHPPPLCLDEANRCFSPPYLRNMELENVGTKEVITDKDDFKDGDQIILKCKKGFGTDFQIANCTGNKWKYSPITCQKIKCGLLAAVKNGYTEYLGDKSYNTIAKQTCNRGYETRCSITNINNVIQETASTNCEFVCDTDGKWKGPKTICEPLRCPRIQAPRNGTMIMPRGNLVIGSKVKFSCDPGFFLVGSGERVCLENGDWDGQETVCQIRECDQVPSIKNGQPNSTEKKFGTVVEYTCDKNSNPLNGLTKIKCSLYNNTVRWEPQDIPSCNINCVITQKISGKIINENPENVYAHLSTLKVKCKTGYEIDSTIVTPLTDSELKKIKDPICINGVWSKNIACVPSSCKTRPKQYPNTTVKFFSRKHGSVARYVCNDGFKIKSNFSEKDKVNLNTVRCNEGKWIGNPPECEPIICEKPKMLPGINIQYKGLYQIDDKSYKISNGEKIIFKCINQSKYRLIGPRIAICMNGQWIPREKPQCDLISHDIFPWEILYKKNTLLN